MWSQSEIISLFDIEDLAQQIVNALQSAGILPKGNPTPDDAEPFINLMLTMRNAILDKTQESIRAVTTHYAKNKGFAIKQQPRVFARNTI